MGRFFTKVALGLAEMAGKTWMFYLLLAWMAGWMGFATAGIWIFGRDKYPFVFLLFLSNIVQLLYLPLLQIKAVYDSQQHREAHGQMMEQHTAEHNDMMMQHGINHSEVTDLLAKLHDKLS